MTGLPAKILALHSALDASGLPHAFGGALALAWCTAAARGTIDIDVNVFVAADAIDRLAGALPTEVDLTDAARELLTRDGQVRLWWDRTPVDVFLNTTPFHEQAAGRVAHHDFGGTSLPFLACADLAVFKAFFDRTKDWADLEAMVEVGGARPGTRQRRPSGAPRHGRPPARQVAGTAQLTRQVTGSRP